MAPKQPTTTTQITEVKLPDWVNKAAEENYNFAKEVAGKEYTPYEGKTVAGFNPDMEAAFNFFKGNMGTGQDDFAKASRMFSDPGTARAERVRAGQFTDVDLSKYMNPFIDNVENKALGALDEARIQSLMHNADKAASASAFGGSRHGIVDAVTNAESAKDAGLLSADLRKSAFDTASGLAMGDIDRRLQAGMANQSADLAAQQTNINSKLQGAQGLLQAGGAKRDANQQDFMGLLGIGQTQQMQEQRELGDAYNRWKEEQDHDLEQLNILLSSLGMSPYGKTEDIRKETSGGSSGTDFAQMGLGILSLLMGLPFFSDRTMKKDIKKVGEKSGVDIYSYRYKGDPPTAPKVVGPMAQDIERVRPGSTGRTADGKMTVPLGVLAEYV